MVDAHRERHNQASTSHCCAPNSVSRMSGTARAEAMSTPAQHVLHSELAAWTSRALRTCRSEPLYGRSSGTLDGVLAAVTRFKLTARGYNGLAHPFGSLPRPVLLRICSYLNALETLNLTHTCHSFRATLVGMPEAWCRIPMSAQTSAWIPHALPPEILGICAERSRPYPLKLGIALKGELFSEQVAVLTRHAHQLEALHVMLVDGNTGQLGALWSSLLQQALGEPAPQLNTLHITHRVALGHFPASMEPLILWNLFSGVAPFLRRVELVSVRLSPTLDYSIFQNVTVFSYEPGMEAPSVNHWHVLASMPKLETFLWGGPISLVGGNPSRVARSLRNVFLSHFDGDLQALRAVLPVDQLAELWIAASSESVCAGLADLYPCVQGISISCGHTGLKSLMHVPGPQGTTEVMFSTWSPSVYSETLLEPFPSITWITVHEHLLDNYLTGAPPAFPAVTVLAVILASHDDHSAARRGANVALFGEWGAGIAAADPDEPWRLPALREIRITSQPTDTVGLEHAAHSIALEDLAGWIRRGIAIEPQARKLDSIVLSGTRVVDHDFCAAWRAIMSLSESLELLEQPDTLYYTSAGDRDFRSRASSLTDGGWGF